MLLLLLELFRNALFFFGVVSRGGFPRPLTRGEEEEAIAQMRAGDARAREKLIEHNLRLVSYIVKKYAVPGYTQEDLVSVGTLGLIKAVDSFKPESGATLSTYAARCIENEALMLLRASKKRRGDVSLTDPIGTDGEGNDITFIDILGTDADHVESEVERRVSLSSVRALIDRLPKREKIIMQMRYGLLDGRQHPQHEVARMLGISRSYVSRIEKHAVETIRRELGE